ncbi:MAG: hypothetical protein KDD47_09520, partial [Acidobacteria bacterium]|nr:hypothetical protein [Acidobacteriota bacterium]
LVWDANGNLIQKGDQHLQYDFRNRLTRVLDDTLEIASYTYDAFNRRIEKDTPSAPPVDFAWSGLQSIEEFSEGTLLQRRTYGLGVDEIAHMEINLDRSVDGSLEVEYYPIYDSSGNLVLLTGTSGQRVGSMSYSPFGKEQRTGVDLTPTRVVSVTVANGSVVIEFSEEINEDRLESGLGDLRIQIHEPELGGGGSASVATSGAQGAVGVAGARGSSPSTLGSSAPSSSPGSGFQSLAAGTVVSATADRPVQLGRQARRRLVLTPETPPAEGTQLELLLAPEAMADLFLNEPASDFVLPFTWPAAGSSVTVLYDSEAPRIDQVVLVDGKLEIEFSERIDLATTAGIEIDGQPTTWTELPDGYTLQATTAVVAGSHTLTVTTALTDLAGTPLPELFEAAFSYDPTGTSGQSAASTATLDSTAATSTVLFRKRIYFRPPDDQVSLTTLGNFFGYHGRPLDLETGFVYFRNRFFDTEL